MKIYIIIPILSAMIMFCGFGFSQNSSIKGEQAIDAKLSLKEQLNLLQAGRDNPVIALVIETDNRNNMEIIATEDDFGPSNDKAEEISDDDRILVNTVYATVSAVNSSGANTQPEGNKPENAMNYYKTTGDNTQPHGEKPENVVKYQTMKGSNEQPEGEKPKK